MLGPDIGDGSFKATAIKSIHYKRLPVQRVCTTCRTRLLAAAVKSRTPFANLCWLRLHISTLSDTCCRLVNGWV